MPLIADSIAFANKSANVAAGASAVRAVQVPEYSPDRPAAAARQLPVHADGDFAADHPPVAVTRPCASFSVHVPVTAPVFGSSVAVHVPASVRPLLLRADHVLRRPSVLDVCASARAPNDVRVSSRQKATSAREPVRVTTVSSSSLYVRLLSADEYRRRHLAGFYSVPIPSIAAAIPPSCDLRHRRETSAALSSIPASSSTSWLA